MAYDLHNLSTEVLLMEREQEERIRLQIAGQRDSRASSLMRAERLEDEYHIQCFQDAEDEKYDVSILSREYFERKDVMDGIGATSDAPSHAVQTPDGSISISRKRAMIEAWIAGTSVPVYRPEENRLPARPGRRPTRAPEHEKMKEKAKAQRKFLYRKWHSKSKQRDSRKSNQSKSLVAKENSKGAKGNLQAMSDEAVSRQIVALEQVVCAGLRLADLYEERERRQGK